MLKFRNKTRGALAAVLCGAVFLFSFQSRAETGWHTGLPVDLYAKAETGFYLLNLPSSSPFVETDSDEYVTKNNLPVYDSSWRSAPVFKGTLGAGYEAAGLNLFTEARGFYTSVETGGRGCFSRPGSVTIPDGCTKLAPQTDRRNYFGWMILDRSAIETFIFGPNLSSGFFDASVKRETEFYGADMAFGITFGPKGGGTCSLSIGPAYMALNTKTDISLRGQSSGIYSMTLKETLDASYTGGLFGMKVDAPFMDRWKFSFATKFGVYFADAEYKGGQNSVFFGERDSSLNLKDDEIAVSAGMSISLQSKWFDIAVVKAEGGIEYLSHAPVMDYASIGDYNGNENLSRAPTRTRAARMNFEGAAGLFAALSLGVEL